MRELGAQLQREQMRRLEVELAGKLWSRSASDRHSDQRAALKRFVRTFDGGGRAGDDAGTQRGRQEEEEDVALEYRQIIKPLRALLLPSGNDEDEATLRCFVRYLDFDRSGTISLDELSDRLLAVNDMGSAKEEKKKENSRRGNGEVEGGDDDDDEEDDYVGGGFGGATFDAEELFDDDALFEAPPARGQATESDYQRRKRAAALEVTLLERLERR